MAHHAGEEVFSGQLPVAFDDLAPLLLELEVLMEAAIGDRRTEIPQCVRQVRERVVFPESN